MLYSYLLYTNQAIGCIPKDAREGRAEHKHEFRAKLVQELCFHGGDDQRGFANGQTNVHNRE